MNWTEFELTEFESSSYCMSNWKNYCAYFPRDVSDYLSYEHRVFNTDEFLKTREPEDQPFYKKVTFQLIIYLVFNLQK